MDNSRITLDKFSTSLQFQSNNLAVTLARTAGLLVALLTATQVLVDKAADAAVFVYPAVESDG